MKMRTKLISFLLAAVLIFSYSAQLAFAAADIPRFGTAIVKSEDPEAPDGEDPEAPGGEDPEIPGGEDPEVPGGEDPEVPGGEDPELPAPKPQYAADTVATLSLCSNWTGFPSLGHIWVYVENVSDHPIKVGAYEVPVGQGVSIGTFGLTRSDGFGIYYNIEAYTGNFYGMGDALSLKTELNNSELDGISKKIANSNFWDPIVFNCAFFAITTWMKGGGSFVFPVVVFPALARLQMRTHNPEKAVHMYYPSRDQVLKQKGSGSSATTEIVKDGSVDTPPG